MAFTNLSDHKVYDARNIIAQPRATNTTNTTTIHEYIVHYFDYPTLVKLKNENGNSIYVAKVSSMLLNTYRYIFAICKQDSTPILTNISLNNLKWISFMTRTLENDIGYCPIIRYRPKNEKIDLLTLISSDKNTYQYTSNIFKDVKISLLCTQSNIYPQRGNINSALETFESVITFI
jgi:hypothetical protein